MARRNLRRLLSRYGFQVTEAPDGMTGLDAARRDPSIDLLLCDVDLPDIDGHTVVRLLRSEAGTTELPIIAVTADVYIGSREESLAAGCNDWEPKPINFQRLRKKTNQPLALPATDGP